MLKKGSVFKKCVGNKIILFTQIFKDNLVILDHGHWKEIEKPVQGQEAWCQSQH